jgi:hypothetical protein
LGATVAEHGRSETRRLNFDTNDDTVLAPYQQNIAHAAACLRALGYSFG